jgi:FkbM family methyltransferase
MPNFVASQGVWAGLKLCFTMIRVRWKPRGSLHRIYVPSFGQDVLLRNHESDLSILFQIAAKREYGIDGFSQGASVHDAYARILAAGRIPLIIDAGGNIGFAALFFARCFPRSHIVSIEPDPENAAILKRNLADLPSAEVLVAGLWNRKTSLKIANPGAGPGGIRVEEVDDQSTGIPTVTIDDILAMRGGYEPLILKVDIEGAEATVFEPACTWINRFPLVAIELHDWMLPGRGTSRNFLRAIAEGTFDVVLSGENLLCFSVRRC